MVLLSSHDRWNEHAELDPESGRIEFFIRDPKTVRPSQIQGKASELAGRTLVLWNDGGRLRLHVDDERFLLTDDIMVHHERGDPAVFVVSKDGAELLRWEYESPSWGWAQIDPTFDDDQFEDFDFGEYVANVTAEVQRRPRVHNLAWLPSNFEHPMFLLPEVRGILELALPGEAPALMKEVRRWCWSWDEPERSFVRIFCSWCDAQEGSKVQLRSFGPEDEPHSILCGACVARSLEVLHARGRSLISAWLPSGAGVPNRETHIRARCPKEEERRGLDSRWPETGRMLERGGLQQ